MPHLSRPRRLPVLALATVGALVLVAGASAHAIVSPPVAKAKALQQFTLSVPTEKENATTTQIELTVPAGFAIDSFEPAPTGWKRQVQSTGSGEYAVVQKVTWTGGSVPTGEDSVFRFNAEHRRDEDLHVRRAANILRRLRRRLERPREPRTTPPRPSSRSRRSEAAAAARRLRSWRSCSAASRWSSRSWRWSRGRGRSLA